MQHRLHQLGGNSKKQSSLENHHQRRNSNLRFQKVCRAREKKDDERSTNNNYDQNLLLEQHPCIVTDHFKQELVLLVTYGHINEIMQTFIFDLEG